MQTVLLLARLLANLLGMSFEDEWACWYDLIAAPKYVCEHLDKNHDYRVFSNDGIMVYIRLNDLR